MKILHTADWQLGKPFAGVPDGAKRILLQQERINTLDRIGAVAREHSAGMILVAGDAFDSPSVTKATVSAACGAIGRMGCPVFVIPGNHDHGGPGSIWDQEFFREESRQLAPNLTVLLKPEPIELDQVVLFPCPLLRRHESSDPTAWLRQEGVLDEARYGGKPRIALVHGTVQGFGAQEDDEEDGGGGQPNLVDLDRLPETGLDYLALGDWHGTKEITPRAWYSGTPELDRFPKGAANQPGNVLVVDVGRGNQPRVEVVPTARHRWQDFSFHFSDDSELDRFDAQLREMVGANPGSVLVRMELEGSLGIGATTRLEGLLEAWAARLVRLRLSNRAVVAPTPQELDELTRRPGDPLISRVAARLAGLASTQGEEGNVARLALRQLHAACQAA